MTVNGVNPNVAGAATSLAGSAKNNTTAPVAQGNKALTSIFLKKFDAAKQAEADTNKDGKITDMEMAVALKDAGETLFTEDNKHSLLADLHIIRNILNNVK